MSANDSPSPLSLPLEPTIYAIYRSWGGVGDDGLTTHSIHRFNVKRSVWHWINVQCRFRDTFTSLFLEIPGVPESSQCAALDGDSLIRTAGIVESSVGPMVDRGSEEGHGHGFM